MAEIGDLTLFQFHAYLGSIAVVEKLFHSEESDQQNIRKRGNEELVSLAKKFGLKAPKNY